MKSLHIILFCLLTTALYLFSQHINSSSLVFLRRRQSPRKLSLPSINHKHQYHAIQVDEEKSKSRRVQESFMPSKYEKSVKKLDKLVYNMDYHGVSTHPTPTPKHPKP